MPVPPLRQDGTLPLGIHQATLDEVLAAYPGSSTQRQSLNTALTDLVAGAARLGIVQRVALDGSFVTNAPNPGDVDLVLLTPGVYQLDGEQRFLAEGVDLLALDIQFAHDAQDFDSWVEFFSTQRDLTRKGTIELLL